MPLAHPQSGCPPLIVAGMHASGTSLAASLLAGLGANLGEQLLAPDRHNPEGYFEDLDFVALQSRMMHSAARADDGGHPDWGWTESEHFDRATLEAYRTEALELFERKRQGGGVWGWKNPRTSVTLDFWQRLAPRARYLFIYRFPWEVADSLQRLGAEVFLRNPEYAYRIWGFYNRQLLDFVRQRPHDCLLVSANALLAAPEQMDDLLRAFLGSEVPDGFVRSKIRPGIFGSAGGRDPRNPMVTLLEAARPDCLELLRDLDAAAALPSATLWGPAELVATAPTNPRLSVLIPCYNHGEFLIEAVASAERAAADVSLEVVIVNDGSDQPRTAQVLGALRGLGYAVHDQNRRGLPAARNAGLSRARADYLLPLDADDRLRPGFAKLAFDLMETAPALGVVYGDYWKFGLVTELVQPPPFSLPRLLCGNFIPSCAVIRRRLLADCGGWDEQMAAWEDWELWIAAATRGWQFRHADAIAFDYRQRPDSMVTACARAEVGEPLQNYIVDKHRAAYLEQLPKLLLTVQDSSRALAASGLQQTALTEQTAALGQRLALLETASAEAARTAAAEQSRLVRLVEELSAGLADSQRQLAELGGQLQTSELERGQLVEQGNRLSAELERTAARLEESNAERHEVGSRLADSELERQQLVDLRYRLYEELRGWAERVRAMENTTAWRARRRLAQMRDFLRF